LEQKNIALKNKLRDYRYDANYSWEEFKTDFNREVDVVGKAINDIFTKKD